MEVEFDPNKDDANIASAPDAPRLMTGAKMAAGTPTLPPPHVMAGLEPAIHALRPSCSKAVTFLKKSNQKTFALGAYHLRAD
jgi:hypothetical protein